MMNSDHSKLDARRNGILEILHQTGKVRIQTLSQQFGTSEVTIRNDLSVLEKKGCLERVPGGAVQTMKNYYNMDLQQRQNENAASKQSIARVAASLVNDGDTLFINSGTTTHFTALELKRFKNLKVVTNAIAIAMELASVPTLNVTLLGGMLNPQYAFTYGANLLNELRSYKADKAILSVDGVCGRGITTYHAEEAEVSKLMLNRSRTIIIVSDHTKLGRESFLRIGSLSPGYHLVTNRCNDPDVLEQIKEIGVNVLTD